MDEVLAEIIDREINKALELTDRGSAEFNSFEELISFGELVDRLSIVNLKLFDLKNDVMHKDDPSFRAWAAVQDVNLVNERARLKKCINDKISYEINRQLQGVIVKNEETKRYA